MKTDRNPFRQIRILTLCIGCSAIGASAQTFTEWQDPEVNAVNRQPMHASFFAYESDTAAKNGKELSRRFLPLDGEWRFDWTRDADRRPKDFFRTDFDDGSWATMPVPGLWELHGYGDPIYVNEGYPWREQFTSDPPNVPVAGNHVGSYRRTIEIPASWEGRQVIAHFGSATSNLYLWVNGHFVGYSEDSKLECEFDVTRYVRPGANLFALQIFRWSDGTYLEDQDFFRFSGLARENYLYARDRRHIDDIRLDATLSDGRTHGILDAELTLSPAAKGGAVEIVLSDRTGKELARERAKIAAQSLRLTLDAGAVNPWSAELPELYDVRITLEDPSGRMLETVPLHAGFRDVKIEGGQLLVNGRPILIKGVNRHEMDPDGGYIVSEARMIEDIRILKANNFNAVRTCHYPDDPRWYDLCDRYGIYLVAEADIESHGMGYGEKTLAKDPRYAKAHLERNERNVRRNINHPSVIVWSLGNEAGDGPNFDACYDWIKNYDPSRPVHYERAIYSEGARNTEICCPMYWSHERCEKYLNGEPKMPLIQCEYAHAMGNSGGGFGDYWKLIRKYPGYQGGYIWDFADQSQRKTGKGGVGIWGYGGDWNPYDASDCNFCDNGLVAPDRTPNPHLFEARYWQQPLWCSLDDDGRTLRVFNEYFFRTANNCYLRWTILRDGDPWRSGIVSGWAIRPQQTRTFVLPYDPARLPADGELLLNVEFRLCDAEPLLAPDHRIAYQQFPLREAAPAAFPAAGRRETSGRETDPLRICDRDRNYLIVENADVRIDFRRADGFIVRYEIGGAPLLDAGARLEPNFWRAPTDNDYGAGLQRKNRVWADPGLRLVSLEKALKADTAVVTAHYALERTGGALEIEYRIASTGAIAVSQRLAAGDRPGIPDLMRFGMRMRMPAAYDAIDYYGRGPWENYADRKDGALLGRYRQTVDEQFYPYIRPQETGTKSDVRRWRQTDAAGRGLEIAAAAPFFASALHYAQEALDEGPDKRQGHSPEIVPDTAVWLCIDGSHCGVGGINSWGQLPQPPYRLPYKDYAFEFELIPVGH